MSSELSIGDKRIRVGDLVICPVTGVPLDRKRTAREITRTHGTGDDARTHTAYVDLNVKDEHVG